MNSDIKIVEIQTYKTPVRCRTPLKFGAVVVEELPIGYARVVAENRNPASVRLDSIASNEPKYCFDDEDCEDVAGNMDRLLVRRLPVVNRQKQLVGIVSIEDIRPRQAA